jgi:hypothetical protein
MLRRMALLTFDTHAAVKDLRELGIGEPQAEGIVNVVTRSAEQRTAALATRDELREALAKVEHKIELAAAELRGEMETGFAELRGEITASQNRVILWMTGAMTALLGIAVAVIKLL